MTDTLSERAGTARERAGDPLRPFVPRIAVDWLRDTPGERARVFPGTMVFADVSGFTELTERLSRKGKAGSEEIADVLDAAFAELVAAAYGYDADLLKWGGDALLLLFRGDGHVLRAAAGAQAMQQALVDMQGLRTSVGPVRLRMSVGVHTGDFHLFLVGGVHRELVVAGADATVTVATEAIADAGEIALSAPTAAHFDPALLGPERDGVTLLTGRVEATPSVPPFFDTAGVDLARLLPAEYSRELRGDPADPEHRHVAVAFVEVCDTDAALERDGPEAFAEALDERVSAVQEACLRFGVTFAQTDISKNGVKAILLAGAPRSAGGDEEELLLRASRAIVEQPGRLPVRVGANSGRVFAGIVGPPTRRTYTFYGDAINTAARIMVRAPAGRLYAREDMLELCRTAYQLTPVEPFAAKGKAELVRAQDVGPALGEREQAAIGPFVGRDAELDALRTALQAAREGHGRTVVVTGDAGIGKTRLLGELRAYATGTRGVVVQCEQVDAARPYAAVGSIVARALQLGPHAPLAEAEARLRRAVETAAPQLAPWLPLLGVPLGLDIPATAETRTLDERFVPERVAESVGELLHALVPDAALVVLDDAHWLDDASNGLVGHLLQRLATTRWLVVVARREREGGFTVPEHAPVERVELAPLDRGTAAELVDLLTEDAPLPLHVVEAIAERSGGSPLFLTGLVTAVREGGADVEHLPGSVEALMAAHIDELPARDRTALRHASVLGVRFDVATLADALELDAPGAQHLLERLDGFLARHRDGTVAFRHGLLREAAYEGLPYRVRRRLHGKVGAVLEEHAGADVDDDAARLSHHFREAGRWDKAYGYAWVAGSRAKAVYANVDAAALLERAYEAARRLRRLAPEELAKIAEALADVRLALGDLDGAQQAFRDARRRVRGDAVEQARLLYRESFAPYRRGDYRSAQRLLDRALSLVAEVRSLPAAAQRAQVAAHCANVQQRLGRPDRTIAWCERAIAEAQAAEAREALADALTVLDYAYMSLGQPEHAVHGRRALEIYDALGRLDRKASVLNNLGVLAYYAGKWNDALDYYARARETWERAGNRSSVSAAAFNIGELLTSQGRLDEAEPLLREALRLRQTAGAVARTAEVLSELGRLEARRGNMPVALERLYAARADYAQAGEEVGVLDVDARIAETVARRGDAERALSLAADALRRAGAARGGSLLVPELLRAVGYAHLGTGRLEAGRRALEESLAAAQDVGSDYAAALAADALVHVERVGGGDGRARELRDELFERLGIVASPIPSIAA